jgi:pimeloyl-ACP methyl ester carboxylesterase
MGGAVATVLAGRHPGLVDGLINAEGNLDPGRGTVSAQIAAIAEDSYVVEGHTAFVQELSKTVGPDLTNAAFLNSFTLASPRAMHRTSCSLIGERRPTFREVLCELSIPRTYLVGEHSQMEDVSGLSEAGVAVVTVPGAGHGLSADNLDGFVECVAQAMGRA